MTLSPETRARLEAELGRVLLGWLDRELREARAAGDAARQEELRTFVADMVGAGDPAAAVDQLLARGR